MFGRILGRFGYSWRGYRRVRRGVQKRLRKHLERLNCADLTAYCNLLDQDPDLMKDFERLMTVSISRFYRDRFLWVYLENDLLDRLHETYGDDVNIWIAGCACGEEAYSLKLLLWQLSDQKGNPWRWKIRATDIQPALLERAEKGIYPRSSLKEIPTHLLDTFFVPLPDGIHFRIRGFLKQGISWEVHDVMDEPLKARFQIIFLRNNLLTYYEQSRILPTLKRLLERLVKGGFLIIGAHEKLPEDGSTLSLRPSRQNACVFQKYL
jgi:chemotaxis methyl-accepting protein methylase